ncbi:MAG: ABC transporter transmembrane domain-containing protein [Clostridia bacterium]
MASVAERLILTLRKQISHKLNKLPLRFFDGNKPGEILSRVTSDLDKVSETLLDRTFEAADCNWYAGWRDGLYVLLQCFADACISCFYGRES